MGRLRLRLDRHSLSNLLKNVSPAAGLIGGPAGIALAGGLSALGDLGRGKNIGQAVKGGVGNAALGAGVGQLASRGVLGSGLKTFHNGVPGVPAVPSGAPTIDELASQPLPSVGTIDAPGAPVSTVSPASPVPVPAAHGGLYNAAKRVGTFAAKNPLVVGEVLGAAGDLATAGSENRLKNAQASALERQTGETLYDFEQRKKRDAELAGLWGGLGTQLGQNIGGRAIAPNPYSVG